MMYMLCALWLNGLAGPVTVRYAKGDALAMKIAAGLWLAKADKGYCTVGDELRSKQPTTIGPMPD